MSQVTFESGAVQSYLNILQGIINRMAANSAGCKTWCITLVSAILVIVSDESNPDYAWLALVPLLLFLFLDSYYLGLEQRYRNTYNDFIKKLHDGTATIDDVYVVSPGSGFWLTLSSTLKAGLSVSIWPFYGLIVLMLWAVRRFIFGM